MQRTHFRCPGNAKKSTNISTYSMYPSFLHFLFVWKLKESNLSSFWSNTPFLRAQWYTAVDVWLRRHVSYDASLASFWWTRLRAQPRVRHLWISCMPELYLKEPTVIQAYGFQLLAARLLELKSKLERLDCFHLFHSVHRSKLIYSSGERWYGIVEVQFVEMTGAVATKQASFTKLHVSVVWAFVQK